MPDSDTIVIKAPPGTKARWVHQSQSEGRKLSDWVFAHVEAALRASPIVVPPDLTISDLKLAREPDGSVSLDTDVIERIEAVNDLPAGYFARQPEDALGALLTAWYRAHLSAGGQPDPVWSDLIGKAQAEDAAGQRISHQPGRA